MPEGSKHAAILIAVSYQAMNHALKRDQDTFLTDCTVLTLFAGFYVGATLNHIFESIGKDIKAFPISMEKSQGKMQLGLQDKLAWFYNEFIEDPKAAYWNEIKKKRISEKLESMFPGFSELLAFRNDLSHGKINESAKSLDTAMRLRQQAKDLVKQLYDIAAKEGYNVPCLVTYRDAIASLTNYLPQVTSASS
jgi:hypothetical protein